MPSLPTLLRSRLGLARRSLRGRGAGRRRFAAGFSGAVALFILLVSWQFFAGLRREAGTVEAVGLLHVALHASLLFALLRDAVAVPGHLLRARDAALFAAAPIPGRRVFALRLGEALADAAGAWAQFTAPFLLGYAAAAPSPWAAALAALGGLAFLVFLSAGSMAALTLLVPRSLGGPGRGRRAALALAGLLAGALLVIAVLLASAGRSGAVPDVSRWVAVAGAAAMALPSGWIGDLVARAAEGKSLPAASGLGALSVSAALALALGALAGRWEDSARMAGETPGGRRRQRLRGSIFGKLARLPWAGARVSASLLARDAILIRREPGMLLDLVSLAFLIGVLPLALLGRASRIPWTALAAIVGAELAFEVASRSLPLERRATHFVRTAPVATGRIGAARIGGGVVAGVAAGLLCWTPSGGWGRVGDAVVWLPALAAGSLVLAAASLGWAASLAFGEPEWRHPRQMLRLPGRLLLLGVLVLAAFGPWIGWGTGPAGGPAGSLSPGLVRHCMSMCAAGFAVAAGALLWGRRVESVWNH
jgi:hypothetical protein